MSAFIILPAFFLCLVGLGLIVHGNSRLGTLAHDEIGGIPAGARWSTPAELGLAFVLTHAGFFFAAHLFRMPAVVAATAGLFTILAAVGSQVRYSQTLKTLNLSTELCSRLKHAHRFTATGLWLIFAPELTVLFIILFLK